ncbi:ABC transporter ATP-binding protein [Kitasatospora sp. NPDC101155]|uniref:ABC transporter ATP-binding protein n=1 Tax=Kitasatospora sp. NPDC101155 TaxID=3364097 RepID=UPI0038214A61
MSSSEEAAHASRTPNGLRQVMELVSLSPPARAGLTRAAGLSVLSGIAAVAGFVCLGFAVGELFAPAPSGRAVGWWAAGALTGLAGSFGARWLAEGTTHEASFELEVTLRRTLADALARMPLGEVHRLGSGRLKKVLQDDVKALHSVVADALPFVGSSVAQPVAALVALGLVQWRLLAAVLLVVPLAVACLSFMTRDYAEQRDRYNRANEDVNAAVVEFVQGMPVVRTFDDGRSSFGRYSGAVRSFTVAVGDWIATTRAAGIVTQLFIVPLPTLLIVAATSVPMLAAHWITPTELLIALLIGAMPIEAIAPLMHLNGYLNDSKAAAARIAEVLAIPPLPEPEHPKEPQDASIALRGVTFGYTGDRGRPALDTVDLDIPAGTVCALVGPSGSGKSTVARLVPRFYDVQEGSVRVGGIDVRDIPSDLLLRHVALVFQEPFLVSGTVAENIRLSKPDATDGEVHAAAMAAAAHEFIVNDLPDGYDTVVGERGGLLSGGQRQRITIARAILSDAPIVILDEATSFADPENEAVIQEALGRLTKGRTVLVIAHRLSTIVDVDQIVVLDGGKVVETGRHAELAAAGGRYAALWERHAKASTWGLPANRTKAANRTVEANR